MSGLTEIGRIRHYLEFVNGGEGRIEIDEPVGFDAAEFKTMQEEGRYGRDVNFAGEEIDFTFYRKVALLGHQFELLIDYDNRYGWESEIKYILSQDTGDTILDYVVGQLDFFTKETDGFDFLSCKIIENTQQALVRRRENIDIDLFGIEDLDGNVIDPVETSLVLLPAKPVIQISKWRNTPPFWVYSGSNTSNTSKVLFQNPINGVIKSGIEDTLSNLRRFAVTSNVGEFPESELVDMVFLEAQEDLTGFSLSLEDIKISYFIQTGADFDDFNTISGGTVKPLLRYYIGTNDDITSYSSGNFTLDFTKEFIGNEPIDRFGDFTGNSDRWDVSISPQELVIPEGIPRGNRLYLAFYTDRYFTINEWLSGTVEALATSTAIPSVVKAVRLIDAMKQTILNINGELEVVSPRYDEKGEWYDNFVFDGNLLRGRDTKFIMRWEDIAKGMQEQNADYELHEDEVFVGKYDDFYTDVESAVFEIAPDETFSSIFNERYGVNVLNFKYKTFTQDKDDDNTIDGVHTDVQLAFANRQVEGEKEIEIPWIRDPFTIESNRKKAIDSNNSGSSSLSDDKKTHIIDVIPLAPETQITVSASVIHFITEDGYLKLLNNGAYNWSLLGMVVGAEFIINTTDNADTYTILELEDISITLEANLITPEDLGSLITEFTYTLDGVDFKMRESEGFVSVDGIASPSEFANLLYTPKRNLIYNWGSYMSTICKYNTADVKMKSFKNEPSLVSQFTDEIVITENSDILRGELLPALITPREIPCKVICSFEEYLIFKEKLKTERGFTRVYDHQNRIVRGYPKESGFMWKDNILSLVLEQKDQQELTNIDYISEAGVYTVDEIGYPQDILPNLDYIADGINIQFFDAVSRPLTNLLTFDRVTVREVLYNSMVELTTAIEALN